MIYPYIVNKNGVWYPAGAEVPEDTSDDTKLECDFSEFMNPPTNSYTKTDIKRMPIAELQKLAKENDIPGADGKTGNELKELLIKKFGL